MAGNQGSATARPSFAGLTKPRNRQTILRRDDDNDLVFEGQIETRAVHFGLTVVTSDSSQNFRFVTNPGEAI